MKNFFQKMPATFDFLAYFSDFCKKFAKNEIILLNFNIIPKKRRVLMSLLLFLKCKYFSIKTLSMKDFFILHTNHLNMHKIAYFSNSSLKMTSYF